MGRRSALEPWAPPSRRRIRAIAARLEKRFGPLEPPRAVDPLDELMLTVLSQHTSDVNAERAFADLRDAFPGGWREVVEAQPADVADAIRSGGLANSKAPRIQAILREVREREGGYDLARLRELPDDAVREYLISLPGIGPKTAAVVLSFALGRDAIPVDTHVHRVTKRLGLVPPRASAERADRLLHDLVPDGLRTPMHVGFIRLGREVCKAPTPRCRLCPLKDLCPTAPRYLGAPERAIGAARRGAKESG
ncbi:MAG TPA: endonuclease III [Actinomycetota bacterium]|nr:endonuclease III [Actinomycetota bacterium]